MSSVDLLRIPLTPEQDRLLALAADVYRKQRTWPAWPYLRSRLGVDADVAETALRTLPTIGRRVGMHGRLYGLAWVEPDISGIAGVPDDTRVGLTMAGLWRAGQRDFVEDFLAVLAVCVNAYDAHLPGPDDTSRPKVSSDQVVAAKALPGSVTAVEDVARWRPHEPPLSRRSFSQPTDGPAWVLELSDRIVGYRAARSIESYLSAVAADLRRDEQELASLFNALDADATAPAPWWQRLGTKAVATAGAALTAVAGAAGTAFHHELERLFTTALSWGEHLLHL